MEEFPHLVEGRNVPTPKRAAKDKEVARSVAKAEQRKSKHQHCVEGSVASYSTKH